MKYFIVITLIVIISSCKAQQVAENRGLPKDEGSIYSATINGPPISRELDRNVEEWHYCDCNKGKKLYEFLTVFLHDGRKVESVYYTVTFDEAGSGTEPCWKFVKMGDYYVPFKVQNLRRN